MWFLARTRVHLLEYKCHIKLKKWTLHRTGSVLSFLVSLYGCAGLVLILK